jgi:host factor-I protein
MTNIEEDILTRSVNEGLKFRLSLSSRDKLPCTLKEFGRYDLLFSTPAGDLTLSKKEVNYLSYMQRVIEPDMPEAETEQQGAVTRSRVQDEFLARYVREKTLALITLVNGEEHRGVIEGYDGFTVLMKAGPGQVLVYKHSLLSIGPGYRRKV